MTAGGFSDEGPGLPRKPNASTPQPGRTIPVVADRIESGHLFGGTREVTIVHGDDLYRLRLTSQNKLLLTK